MSDPEPAPYTYARSARNWATLLAVLGVWLAACVAYLVFDAALWIVGVVLLFTLPGIWDLWTGNRAGATLGQQALAWYSGRRHAEVPLDEIDHVRLVTRLDMSVRAVVVLHTGRKLRLPPEATPPHKAFEAALGAHGVSCQRHHFSFL